jgi:hypothetical protein
VPVTTDFQPVITRRVRLRVPRWRAWRRYLSRR